MGDSFVGTPCHTFAIGDQDGNKQKLLEGGGDGLYGKQYFLVLKERHKLSLFEYTWLNG